MSGFWNKVAGSTPAPAPSTASTTRPWWDLPTPSPQTQMTPGPTPVVTPVEQPKTRAKSARSTDICPDCGSGNYFQPEGMPNAIKQCYECGYNPRFAHSTAGAGMPSDSGTPVRAARQVDTGNNYNPGTIVGRIE